MENILETFLEVLSALNSKDSLIIGKGIDWLNLNWWSLKTNSINKNIGDKIPDAHVDLLEKNMWNDIMNFKKIKELKEQSSAIFSIILSYLYWTKARNDWTIDLNNINLYINNVYKFFMNKFKENDLDILEKDNPQLFLLYKFIYCFVDKFENEINIIRTIKGSHRGNDIIRFEFVYNNGKNVLFSIQINKNLTRFQYVINLYWFIWRLVLSVNEFWDLKSYFYNFIKNCYINDIVEIQLYADFNIPNQHLNHFQAFNRNIWEIKFSHNKKDIPETYFWLVIYDSKRNKQSNKKDMFYPEYSRFENVYRLEYRIKLNYASRKNKGWLWLKQVAILENEFGKVPSEELLTKTVNSFLYKSNLDSHIPRMFDIYNLFVLIQQFPNIKIGSMVLNRLFLFCWLEFEKFFKIYCNDLDINKKLELEMRYMTLVQKIYTTNDSNLIVQWESLFLWNNQYGEILVTDHVKKKLNEITAYNTINWYIKNILLSNYSINSSTFDSINQLLQQMYFISWSWMETNSKLISCLISLHLLIRIKIWKESYEKILDLINKFFKYTNSTNND